MQKATTSELKQTNQKNIFNYIYDARKTSKLELSNQLGLSRPTINQNLKELEELRLIEKNGCFESTGGRKAEAITIIASAKIAIGVEILKHSYEVVAINLYGDIIKFEQYHVPFHNTDDYYKNLSQSVNEFINTLHVASKRILGIGIVIPGLISSDGTCVTYGKLLACTGLTVDAFTRYIPFPCRMIHDAEAAATVELWESAKIQNAIFFHIRQNLSGSLIVDGKFLKGNELKCGVFEHMTLITDGLPCYCGKCGCVESYCSLNALLHKDESVEAFFQHLRAGEPEYILRWESYLDYLATTINNIHMLIDYDVILGGILPNYLLDSDIAQLHLLVQKRTAFPTDRPFIRIGKHIGIPNAKGAALPHIKEYLDTLFN